MPSTPSPGEVARQYQTEDDGPTAPVVVDGCVVFYTESCEPEVLSVAGQRLWQEALGPKVVVKKGTAAIPERPLVAV